METDPNRGVRCVWWFAVIVISRAPIDPPMTLSLFQNEPVTVARKNHPAVFGVTGALAISLGVLPRDIFPTLRWVDVCLKCTPNTARDVFHMGKRPLWDRLSPNLT